MTDPDDLADDMASAGFSLIPFFGPLLAPVVKRLYREVRRERARTTSKALQAAVAAAQMSREDLAKAIADDPRLVPLLTRLLFAAGMNGEDEALTAMGTVVGDAVRQPQKIDEADLILGALTDLRSQHMVVLRALASPAPEGEMQTDPPIWWPAQVSEHTGLSVKVTNLCIAQLVPSGLAIGASGFGGGTRYEATDLGWTLLEVLDRLVDDSPG